MRHSLVCANPRCGADIGTTTLAVEFDRQCWRCQRYTRFKVDLVRITASLMPVGHHCGDPATFDDFDRLMRNNHGVDPKRC